MIRAFWDFYEKIFPPKPTPPPVYKASRFTHVIDSSKKAESFFRKMWNKDLLTVQEEVYVIFIDNNNRIIEWMLLHKGSAHGCQVDIPLLFKFAIKFNASGMFVAHNHPEGIASPTENKDDEMTEEILVIANKLNIRFLDHIIITADSYYSYYESGDLD